MKAIATCPDRVSAANKGCSNVNARAGVGIFFLGCGVTIYHGVSLLFEPAHVSVVLSPTHSSLAVWLISRCSNTDARLWNLYHLLSVCSVFPDWWKATLFGLLGVKCNKLLQISTCQCCRCGCPCRSGCNHMARINRLTV